MSKTALGVGTSGGLLFTSACMLADDCAVVVIGSVEIVGQAPIMTVSGRTVCGRGSSADNLSM